MPHRVRTRTWLVAVALFSAATASLVSQRAAAPATPDVAIDSAQLLTDLRVLASDDMQGRQTGTAGGAKARAYVMERFKASGIQPFGQSYLREFPVRSRRAADGSTIAGVNVVGRIEGRRQPARYIVISAHYDHEGVGAGQVFNGANDNASGTAALFALGHYFSRHPPTNSLILVAFDAEELGLVGSRAFVREPPVDRASIVVNLNADMVGRDADNRLYVTGASRQPFLRPLVARVAERAPITLLMGFDNPGGRGGADWMQDSDQWSFFEAGIPALYIGVEDWEQHHKPTDDYDNMTLPFFIGAVETLRMLVRSLT